MFEIHNNHNVSVSMSPPRATSPQELQTPQTPRTPATLNPQSTPASNSSTRKRKRNRRSSNQCPPNHITVHEPVNHTKCGFCNKYIATVEYAEHMIKEVDSYKSRHNRTNTPIAPPPKKKSKPAGHGKLLNLDIIKTCMLSGCTEKVGVRKHQMMLIIRQYQEADHIVHICSNLAKHSSSTLLRNNLSDAVKDRIRRAENGFGSSLQNDKDCANPTCSIRSCSNIITICSPKMVTGKDEANMFNFVAVPKYVCGFDCLLSYMQLLVLNNWKQWVDNSLASTEPDNDTQIETDQD